MTLSNVHFHNTNSITTKQSLPYELLWYATANFTSLYVFSYPAVTTMLQSGSYHDISSPHVQCGAESQLQQTCGGSLWRSHNNFSGPTVICLGLLNGF